MNTAAWLAERLDRADLAALRKILRRKGGVPPREGGISGRELAAKLGVAASTLSRLLKGRSAESWLAMQDTHELWRARREVDLPDVKALSSSG